MVPVGGVVTRVVARVDGALVRVGAGPGVPDDVLAALAPALAPAEVEAGGGGTAVAGGDVGADGEVEVVADGEGWAIRRDGEAAWWGREPVELRRRVVSEVHLCLAAHARHHTFVHAGCVAWRGAAVAVPGPSGAGKSTLVRALVDAGAEYLSDEYAVLDAAGRAHPYAKPLSLRTGDGVAVLAPSDLGRVADGPRPVVLVVDAPFRTGADWRPERTTGAGVVLPLVANAVAARLRPEQVLAHTAAVAAAGAVLLAGARGDAGATAGAVLAEVDRALDARAAAGSS